jgi:hypothetical protein
MRASWLAEVGCVDSGLRLCAVERTCIGVPAYRRIGDWKKRESAVAEGAAPTSAMIRLRIELGSRALAGDMRIPKCNNSIIFWDRSGRGCASPLASAEGAEDWTCCTTLRGCLVVACNPLITRRIASVARSAPPTRCAGAFQRANTVFLTSACVLSTHLS